MKLLVYFLLVMSITASYCQDMPERDKISYRPPAVAGSFYPLNKDSLEKMISDFLGEKKVISTGIIGQSNIIGLVAPHAGYIYSGETAGSVYRFLYGRKYDAVIIIAPSHHLYFKGASIYNGDGYVTPLGTCLTHKPLTNEISNHFPSIRFSKEGHDWKDSINEHSIEVQLPFLQQVLPNIPIVPIAMGDQEFHTTDLLVKAIYKAIKNLNLNVLLVASSDLSHFHNYKDAREKDKLLINAFKNFDYFRLSALIQTKKVEACGGGPIAVVMAVSELLGANMAQPIKYTTSADSPAGHGNKNRVVGYFGGLLIKTEMDGDLLKLPELSEEDKKDLIETAKSGVLKAVNNEELSQGFSYVTRNLASDYTAFVTLKLKGHLRACMGHIYPSKPLIAEVEEVAKLTATSDSRFGPINKNELDELEYEITVLSRLKKVIDTLEIKPGLDGLYIRVNGISGLLLPQVAAERNWDRTTFLENLCQKAGLPVNYYKDPNAELYRFRALVVK